MASSLEEGLAWIDRLVAGGELDDFHLLHAARADLLRRAGRQREAADAYRLAIDCTRNAAERNYLLRRLGEVCD